MRLLLDYILFLAVCTESDGKLNRGLATRLHFCVSYDLRKKSHRHSCLFACVCTRMCVCMCGRGRSSTSLIQCLVCELE